MEHFTIKCRNGEKKPKFTNQGKKVTKKSRKKREDEKLKWQQQQKRRRRRKIRAELVEWLPTINHFPQPRKKNYMETKYKSCL